MKDECQVKKVRFKTLILLGTVIILGVMGSAGHNVGYRCVGGRSIVGKILCEVAGENEGGKGTESSTSWRVIIMKKEEKISVIFPLAVNTSLF